MYSIINQPNMCLFLSTLPENDLFSPVKQSPTLKVRHIYSAPWWLLQVLLHRLVKYQLKKPQNLFYFKDMLKPSVSTVASCGFGCFLAQIQAQVAKFILFLSCK